MLVRIKFLTGALLVSMTAISACVEATSTSPQGPAEAEAYLDCVVVDFFQRNSGKTVVPDVEANKSIANCSTERNALYQYAYDNSFAGQQNVREDYRKLTAELVLRDADVVIKKTIDDIMRFK